MEHQETTNDSTEIDWNNGDEILILSQRSTRAAMTRPVSEDESVKVIKDKSVAIVDCGASSTYVYRFFPRFYRIFPQNLPFLSANWNVHISAGLYPGIAGIIPL